MIVYNKYCKYISREFDKLRVDTNKHRTLGSHQPVSLMGTYTPRGTRDRSINRSFAKTSFDETLGLTGEVFHFS